MSTQLRLLLVEDSETDGELTVRELEQAGYEVQHVRVDTEEALRAALRDRTWDLVLSDYNVPGFGGAQALGVVREVRTDLPFIFVSGTIGEETAVSAIRAGANDYVMKGNLKRLAPAIERELREVSLRNERRELENQLRQSQKMEAVGRLAGGVAHDFNNLLTAIIGYAQLAEARLAPDHKARQDVREIMSASERAAMLTRQLLAFSRKEVVQVRVLDLGALVKDMAKMLRRLVGEEIQMKVRTEESLGAVQADLGQLEQVLLNLVVNARDAMPNGGRLTIETENVEISEEYAGERIAAQPGAYVLLAVSDTGTGMDEETKSRIFEPFFTTKGPDHGTGLGLATVYGIVQQSGGAIQVYSDLGRGTTFKIYLPRATGVAETFRGTESLDQAPRGTETVLLAEDQDFVAAVVRGTLQSCGYQVLEARNGEEALRMWDEHGSAIDLIITDVVMPIMNGPEFVRRARETASKIKVVFMSGYTEHGFSAQGEMASGDGFLQKPFAPSALARKVREVLDGAVEQPAS